MLSDCSLTSIVYLRVIDRNGDFFRLLVPGRYLIAIMQQGYYPAFWEVNVPKMPDFGSHEISEAQTAVFMLVSSEYSLDDLQEEDLSAAINNIPLPIGVQKVRTSLSTDDVKMPILKTFYRLMKDAETENNVILSTFAASILNKWSG